MKCLLKMFRDEADQENHCEIFRCCAGSVRSTWVNIGTAVTTLNPPKPIRVSENILSKRYLSIF